VSETGPVELADLDLVVAVQLSAVFLGDEIRRRLDRAGYPDLRHSHGYLLQHLLAGPVGVTELARRLAVSQQAVSKSAAELVSAGYVERRPAAHDQRARLLALTEHGRQAVEAARQARAEITEELADGLGPGRVQTTRDTLLAALRQLGAAPAIRTRSVRPPG